MGKGLPRSLARGKGKTTVRKQVFNFKDVAVSVAGTSGVGFGGAVIGDFPEGNILLLGAAGYVSLYSADADIQATYDGDIAVGTVPNANTSLSGTDVDILPSTALGAATAGQSPTVRAANATAAIFDNTDGSLELNLNVLIDDANISGTADMTATGTVELIYAVLLDD